MSPETKGMFQAWLETGTDLQRRHAAYRLGLVDALDVPAKVFAPTPLPLAESLPLLRIVNSCPYRSRDAACGCSGHRCALRLAAPIVTHLDCLDCAKCYGSS
jgi:hypothetical protein